MHGLACVVLGEAGVIELAPNHKTGLPVANPILLAGGVIGCGDAIAPGLRTEPLGAAVVGPVLRRPLGGPVPPRVAEMSGGMVLDVGLQNRGLRAVLRRCAPSWTRLGCPVIVQIADRDVDDLRAVARGLEQARGAAGVELLVFPEADADEVALLTARLALDCDLPVWVKLPLARAADLAAPAVEAGADALVIAQPPRGALMRSAAETQAGAPLPGGIVRGGVYGPLAFPLMLSALLDVAALQLPAVLIACGGIHGWEQARQALRAGAAAVQVDSAAWIEPGLPQQLVAAWRAEEEAGLLRAAT